jgi:hypothetical protein
MLPPMGDQDSPLTLIALACAMKLLKDDIIGILSFVWTMTAIVLAIDGLVALVTQVHEKDRSACGCPEWEANFDITKSGAHDTHDNESSTLGDDETVCDDTGVLNQVPSNIEIDVRVRTWLRVVEDEEEGQDEESQDGEEKRACDEDLSGWENYRKYYVP